MGVGPVRAINFAALGTSHLIGRLSEIRAIKTRIADHDLTIAIYKTGFH